MADAANSKILAPVILAIAVAGGLAAGTLDPVRLAPPAAAAAVGAATLAASLFLVYSAARELAHAKTAFDARRPTTALVTSGAFAVSRNPTYLSMTVGYIGLALLLNSPIALLLAWPVGGALCVFNIKPEERYLGQKFPRAYGDYCARVRRWL